MRMPIRRRILVLAAIALLLQPRALAESVQPAAGALATAPDQTFTADGVSLRYREAGSGEPVLLIHGYTASLDSQIPLANVLASSHRVIAFDVRGFGRSSKFADPSKFGLALVDDVVHLLDHLQIQRAHIVGHSMGALIAANVAAKHPTRVSSVALIAAPFYADKATFSKEVTPYIADLKNGVGLTNFFRWLLPHLPPQAAAGLNAQVMKGNDLPSLIAVLQSLPELAISGLGNTKVPSLVAVGTADPLHPLALPFTNATNSARLLEIEGADHINVLANPAVVSAMRALLQARLAKPAGEREAA